LESGANFAVPSAENTGAHMKEFSPFRYDFQNKCLWRSSKFGADERVELTPKAFDVLGYLINHPGRLIGQDEFLDVLWPKVHVQPEVLKSHILAVRAALGDNPKKPRFIETVRQRGYRFVATVTEGRPVDDAIAARSMFVRLVGRERLMSRLKEYLSNTVMGQTTVVFVSGEAGIGKTAFVEEFLAEAVSGNSGTSVARGQCVEAFGEIEPWYPVLEAISRLCRGPASGETVQLLGTVAPTWLVQFPTLTTRQHREMLHQEIIGATRGRMLREISEFIELIAAQTPTVLLFEDIHWSDLSTLDLISTIARRRSHAKLLLLATYRPADADVAGHPLPSVVQNLRLRRLSVELELEPLQLAAVQRFLNQSGSVSEVPSGLARSIHRQSGGNPLFMLATIDNLVERGFVRLTSDGWELNGPLDKIDHVIAKTLGQAIETQIRRLSGDQQRVIEAGSLTQVSFCAAINAAAINMPPDSFEDVCEELRQKHRIIRRTSVCKFPDGSVSHRYEFGHAIYRQVCVARQSPIRFAHANSLVAARMETLFANNLAEAAPELALLRAAASDWKSAQRYLRLALQTAMKRHAHREALAILEQALMFSEHLSERERKEANIGFIESRAEIYAAAHDPLTSETYEQLAREATDLGLIDVEARALLGLAYARSWFNVEPSLEALGRALCLSHRQSQPQMKARTQMSSFAWRIWISGWNEHDVRCCEAVLASLSNSSDLLTVAWGMIEYSMLLMISTRYREGHDTIIANYRTLIEGAESRPDINVTRAIWMTRLGIPWSLMFCGEFGQALKEFDSGIGMYVRNGNNYGARTLRIYRIWVLYHCMDYPGVLDACRRIADRSESAIEIEAGFDEPILPAEVRLCSILTGLAHAGLGNTDEALTCLHAVQEQMEGHPVIFDWYWRLSVESGLAELWLAKGDLARATLQAERALELALATDERTYQALAWDVRARVALRAADLASAEKVIEKALLIIQEYETPLADWKVHTSACCVYDAVGDHSSARKHRRLAAEEKTSLANSLSQNDPLRHGFEPLLNPLDRQQN
jgi:DNA-binding winged helix-turn-helix (wHTH) protein/tetratricopeptide (TPR) repeat protein